MFTRIFKALASDDTDAVVQVFFIRSGKIIGRDHFHVRVGTEEDTGDILVNFVKQFYSGTPFIPREIMLQGEIEDMAVLEQWLSEKRGRRVNIKVPQKGMKEKLVELAYKNALLVLSQDKERIKCNFNHSEQKLKNRYAVNHSPTSYKFTTFRRHTKQ